MLEIWFSGVKAGWRSRVSRRLSGPHVLVADEDAVVDAQFDGLRFWPRHVFVRGYPALVGGFRFAGGVDWMRVPKSSGYPLASVLLRLVTRGRHPRIVPDCLGIALWALRREGWSAPRGIVTPNALLEWCRKHGLPAEAV